MWEFGCNFLYNSLSFLHFNIVKGTQIYEDIFGIKNLAISFQ